MTAMEAERMTQAQVPVSQLTAWLEAQVYSAHMATQSWVGMMNSYTAQATEQGMNAHWAKVLLQTANSLLEAAVKEETLTNLWREIAK